MPILFTFCFHLNFDDTHYDEDKEHAWSLAEKWQFDKDGYIAVGPRNLASRIVCF